MLFLPIMLNNPTTVKAAAAVTAPTYTVNIHSRGIFVYKSHESTRLKITAGKKVAKFPNDQQHLDLVSLRFPNARYHGSRAAITA